MPKENLLITGASSSLGLAFIRAYHGEFSNIVAHCNSNSDELGEIAKSTGGTIQIVRGDLSKTDGVEQLIRQIDATGLPIHRLAFLAAPRLQLKRFQKLDWSDFQVHFNVEAYTAFHLLRAYLPKMAALKRGKIVFVLSSVLDGKPPQGMADYVVSKHAMLGLMKAAAAEYAAKHICINAVSPSMMETKFLNEIPGIVIEQSAESHPRRANATPSEIIPLLRFLLSDEAGFVTGQNIVASGGA